LYAAYKKAALSDSGGGQWHGSGLMSVPDGSAFNVVGGVYDHRSAAISLARISSKLAAIPTSDRSISESWGLLPRGSHNTLI